MTRFLLSHNRQIDAPELPPITAQQLAAGLRRHWGDGLEAMPLEHPHWMVALQADQTAEAMAERLLQAWRALRPGNGQGGTTLQHQLLALGGRKDQPAAPGAALQWGDWGVDVVETRDAEAFLAAIHWDDLKQGRPVDGVFELRA